MPFSLFILFLFLYIKKNYLNSFVLVIFVSILHFLLSLPQTKLAVLRQPTFGVSEVIRLGLPLPAPAGSVPDEASATCSGYC
jgi:hypothetical protein